MKIPKELKVGGKIYKTEVSDNLFLGKANCSGEILYNDLIIRITPQSELKMQADYVHEMVHAIHSHLGYCEHDEKKIDELANALYMVIQDNPEMFENQKTVQSKINLWVRDKDFGTIHQVGSDPHDSMVLMNGKAEYYNLKAGCGTFDGNFEFVESPTQEENIIFTQEQMAKVVDDIRSCAITPIDLPEEGSKR